MRKEWIIEPVNVNGGFWFRKITPGVALDVEFTISGDVTGGPWGTGPDKWKRTDPIVEPGIWLDDVFGRAGGTNTPTLYIRWHDEHGAPHADFLEIPFP